MTDTSLIAGPYRVPCARIGSWLNDERHGRVEVGGWTTAPISWPRLKKTGTHAPILCGDLVRAVQTESAAAICYCGASAETKGLGRTSQSLDAKKMTDDASPTSRLRRIGETLYGSQWQTELARALQLSDARRVRQWLTGERGIPETIWGELRELLKRRRDEATALLRSWL